MARAADAASAVGVGDVLFRGTREPAAILLTTQPLPPPPPPRLAALLELLMVDESPRVAGCGTGKCCRADGVGESLLALKLEFSSGRQADETLMLN